MSTTSGLPERFRALPPLAKLSVWAVGMLLLVAAAELAAATTGLPLSLLDKNAGGTLLLVGALVSLLAVIASDRRPLVEYGLATPAGWRRQAIAGGLLGGGVYLAYCVVAVWLGVFAFETAAITPGRVAKATLAAASALPVASVQQIVFAGLMLGMLRSTTTRWTAAVAPAAVFAALAGMAKPGGLAGEAGQALFIGLLLLATLLGLLRLRTGSIVFPTGLLAGAIAVRKVIAKLRLLENNPTAEWTPWFAPSADPRQGPLFWLLLAVAIGGVAWVLVRRGERRLADDAEVAASFKRVMPFSNLMAFAPIDRWLAELARARFRVGLAYLPRLAFTLVASTLTTVLTLPERLLAPRLLSHALPGPVFIVGMHRSGTTYLHELMALDPQFRSPRNYEVLNPHGFLTGWLTTAAMTPLLMWRRPMDAVQMTVFSSQEEEFALAAMGSQSPYWMFCFPRLTTRLRRYWHPSQFTDDELSAWQRNYLVFLRKLTWRTRRRPLLKNPVNTSRVATLRAMFPDAKFVYIVRHPLAVYQSNQHFARHGFAVFQLQDADPADNYATTFLANYRAATDACQRDLAQLPGDAAVRVRFEDLEANPVGQLEQVYAALALELTDEFRRRLAAYTRATAGYRKNRFADLSAAERAEVEETMGEYLLQWGYETPPHRSAA